MRESGRDSGGCCGSKRVGGRLLGDGDGGWRRLALGCVVETRVGLSNRCCGDAAGCEDMHWTGRRVLGIVESRLMVMDNVLLLRLLRRHDCRLLRRHRMSTGDHRLLIEDDGLVRRGHIGDRSAVVDELQTLD